MFTKMLNLLSEMRLIENNRTSKIKLSYWLLILSFNRNSAKCLV
jgi:hypothetical protein